MAKPRITCVLTYSPKTIDAAVEVIADFARQTYAPRRLYVPYAGDTAHPLLVRAVDALNELPGASGVLLGCDGSVGAAWDTACRDDPSGLCGWWVAGLRSQPDRLMSQHAALSRDGSFGCALVDRIVGRPGREFFLVDRRFGRPDGHGGLFADTLLCRATATPVHWRRDPYADALDLACSRGAVTTFGSTGYPVLVWHDVLARPDSGIAPLASLRDRLTALESSCVVFGLATEPETFWSREGTPVRLIA
jgi:hypothetical protein